MCAAGLHLGLLKEPEDAASAEGLASARAALQAAVAEVRALSYQTDPGVVRRLGVGAAMSYLASPGVTVEVESEPRDARGERAAMLHRIALECLPCAAPLHLKLSGEELRVEAGAAFEAAEFALLVELAARAGVRVEIDGSRLHADARIIGV